MKVNKFENLYRNLVAAVNEASNDAVRLPETVHSAVVGNQDCHARAPDGQLRTVYSPVRVGSVV